MSTSNIDTAKLFFGIVLDKLQASFPAAVHSAPNDFWPEFEKIARGGVISIKDSRRSFRTVPVEEAAENEDLKAHYTKLMLRWMQKEGYTHSDPTSGFKYDYVLSTKALAVLDRSFEGHHTIGAALAKATGRVGEQVQSEMVARLVKKIFEVVLGVAE